MHSFPFKRSAPAFPELVTLLKLETYVRLSMQARTDIDLLQLANFLKECHDSLSAAEVKLRAYTQVVDKAFETYRHCLSLHQSVTQLSLARPSDQQRLLELDYLDNPFRNVQQAHDAYAPYIKRDGQTYDINRQAIVDSIDNFADVRSRAEKRIGDRQSLLQQEELARLLRDTNEMLRLSYKISAELFRVIRDDIPGKVAVPALERRR